MAYKVYIVGDLVKEREEDVNQRIESLPTNLEGQPDSDLMWDGNNLVDAKTLTDFYVDDNGIKHVTDFSGGQWGFLAGINFLDELVNDGGTWRVKTDAEILAEGKAELIQEIKDHISSEMLLNSGYSNRYREAPEYSYARNHIVAQGWYTSDQIFGFMYNEGVAVYNNTKTITEAVAPLPAGRRPYLREIIQEGVIQAWFGTIQITQLNLIADVNSADHWQASTPYSVGDYVFVKNEGFYRCITAHTSSTWGNDLSNWTEADVVQITIPDYPSAQIES